MWHPSVSTGVTDDGPRFTGAWDAEEVATYFSAATLPLRLSYRLGDDVAFDVSDNDGPYRGVRGAGRVTTEADAEKALLRTLLARYLGRTGGSLGERLLSPDRREVRLRIAPRQIHSWDYGDWMSE